jgi:Tfp pilus assembly protein PilN
LIKINLVREGRAVRGAAGAPAAAAAGGGAGVSGNLNNIFIIGLLVIGVVVSAGWWLVVQRKLDERDEQVRTRSQDAGRLETIIKDVAAYQEQKDNLQKRIDLINQLKQNQKGPVRVMDRLSQDLPDLVWLDSMVLSSAKISVAGRGLNPNAIANFVANIKNDPYFEEPNVGDVTQMSVIPPVYSFNMDFAFSYTPRVPGAAGAAVATGTAGATGTSGTASTTGGAKK